MHFFSSYQYFFAFHVHFNMLVISEQSNREKIERKKRKILTE